MYAFILYFYVYIYYICIWLKIADLLISDKPVASPQARTEKTASKWTFLLLSVAIAIEPSLYARIAV